MRVRLTVQNAFLIQKTVQRDAARAEAHLGIRIPEEEAGGIGGVGVKHREVLLQALHEGGIGGGVRNAGDREHSVEAGAGGLPSFWLHVIAAGVNDTGDVREVCSDVFGSEPVPGIVAVIVVAVCGDDGGSAEVFIAPAPVRHGCKHMVIRNQVRELFFRGSGCRMGIDTVFRIAAAIGGKNGYLHGFIFPPGDLKFVSARVFIR